MIQNLENEEWKDVIGYEGLYQVSNLGRVKSLDRIVKWNNTQRCRKGKLLKPILDYAGYLKVHLCKDGCSKKLFIHRLVAQAFIPNPNNLPCVNHKSENKLENTVENLEWCDAEYNNIFGTRLNRMSDSMKQKYTEGYINNKAKSVYQIDKNSGEIISKFNSAKEAERYLNDGKISNTIAKVCNNIPFHNTAYGYRWQWV